MLEEIRRVTKKDRQSATLQMLSVGIDAFGDEAYPAACRKLKEAKELSPRSSAIRELLGISSYRCRKWADALSELRAYRRLTGDTDHMPMEMDALRALNRDRDIEAAWSRFQELGGNPSTEAEANVVYASFLLDQGRAAEAWNIVGPERLAVDAPPYERRCWFVAARAALELDEQEVAAQIIETLRRLEPDMPGLEELIDQV
ncbi:MAG: hypothetical protein OXH95_09475 [bacterium]|nr:hypothetical protein [bacterium]